MSAIPKAQIVNTIAKSAATSALQTTLEVPQLKSSHAMKVSIFSTVMSIFDQRDITKPLLENFSVDGIVPRTSTLRLDIEGLHHLI